MTFEEKYANVVNDPIYQSTIRAVTMSLKGNVPAGTFDMPDILWNALENGDCLNASTLSLAQANKNCTDHHVARHLLPPDVHAAWSVLQHDGMKNLPLGFVAESGNVLALTYTLAIMCERMRTGTFEELLQADEYMGGEMLLAVSHGLMQINNAIITKDLSQAMPEKLLMEYLAFNQRVAVETKAEDLRESSNQLRDALLEKQRPRLDTPSAVKVTKPKQGGRFNL